LPVFLDLGKYPRFNQGPSENQIQVIFKNGSKSVKSRTHTTEIIAKILLLIKN